MGMARMQAMELMKATFFVVVICPKLIRIFFISRENGSSLLQTRARLFEIHFEQAFEELIVGDVWRPAVCGSNSGV